MRTDASSLHLKRDGWTVGDRHSARLKRSRPEIAFCAVSGSRWGLAFLFDVMCCINLARCEEPLSEDEVHTIVASVARTHLKRLRGDA
jgi:hypothetical protein